MLTLEDGRKIVQILKELDYAHRTALNKNMLSQLFFQSKMVDELPAQFINRLDESLKKEILISDNGKVYSNIRIAPFSKYYFVTDSPFLSSTGGLERYYSNRKNFYGYIGSDGMRLINYIYPEISHRRYEKGLDLCAGSGIIGITLSSLFESMHGVDIDEAAVNWMRFNTRLNGIKNFTAYQGDLYLPVEGLGPFDLIIANPSYRFYPAEIITKHQIKRYEAAGELGTELVVRIIEGFEKYLTPEGTGCICALTPILKGEDYLLQRIVERFSKFDYALEICYDFVPTLSDFKEYYHELGITEFYFVIIKVQRGFPFRIRKRYSRFCYLSRLPALIKLPDSLNRFFIKMLNSLYFRAYCYRNLRSDHE